VQRLVITKHQKRGGDISIPAIATQLEYTSHKDSHARNSTHYNITSASLPGSKNTISPISEPASSQQIIDIAL